MTAAASASVNAEVAGCARGVAVDEADLDVVAGVDAGERHVVRGRAAQRDDRVDVVVGWCGRCRAAPGRRTGWGTAGPRGLVVVDRRRDGQPWRSSRPPVTVSAASRTRSRARRSRPAVHRRTQVSGTADWPQRAPSSPPAIAATVSVSSPIRTAACSACCRCRHGYDACGRRVARGRGLPDRRPGGLERGDREPVGAERCPRSPSRPRRASAAHSVAALRGQQVESGARRRGASRRRRPGSPRSTARTSRRRAGRRG